ncbi:MAG: hypothetical protein Q8S54_16535 [Bacteroidota bacterium]|nr:hypothetical protein [Odoribacter sp.]MDP3644778.1 hypothetical protein [Bacteroidota bacterium]
MPLNKGKHIIEEIDGTRCSLVEKGISPERMEFLKKLLEINKYSVKVASEGETGTFKIGVTDMLFNPVVDVYRRSLMSPSGKKVTPAYWLQESDKETEAEVNYWDFK